MTNPADGAPLTRRQLRERAEAEAALKAAESGPPAYAQPAASPAADAAGRPVSAEQASAEQPVPQRPQATPTPRPAPVGSGPTATTPATTASGASAGTSRPTQAAPSVGSARPAARVGDPQRGPAPQRTLSPEQAPVRQTAGETSPAADAVASNPARQSVQRPSAQERQPALSRRSRREQANGLTDTGTMIVPPHQTGKIRTVDETGELTASRPVPTGQGASTSRPATPAARPAAADAAGSTMSFSQRLAASAPPSARPANGRTQPPAAQGIPAQATSVPTAPGTVSRTSSWAPVAAEDVPWAPVPTVSSTTEATARAATTAPPGAPAASYAPATPAAAPAAEPVGTGTDPASGTEVPPGLAEGAESFTAAPRWDAITTGAAAPASSTPASRDEDDDEDDEDYDDSDHKYTWLHYVILVALAFVLGLILWKVALEGESGAASASSALHAPSSASSSAAPSAAPVLETWADQAGWDVDDASGATIIEEVL